MHRQEIKEIIEESIRTETEYEGDIDEKMGADEIDGWDSLAHVRIIFRIDHHLGTQVELIATYATNTIADLIELFVNELK
jgi:acyl carrier protein|tara:strand:+ start:176 stop:415 length:240 start_codon:yes stop_codon:yes gene_type:complete